jgi:hypothetical protein
MPFSGLNFTGTWDEFFELVKTGKVIYGDQYTWLKDWSENRDEGKVLFVRCVSLSIIFLHLVAQMVRALGQRASGGFVSSTFHTVLLFFILFMFSV